ncbi:hypothetical protein [Aeromonas sp. MdU4]|uniref:hypothetical protein n=1 Tax=Aeromonas sp. MdU4 TaxID=3342819 RepID=UPI0035B935DD
MKLSSVALQALSPYLFIILTVALLSLGYIALPVYFALAMVIYPVLVATLANDWEQQGLVYRESALVDVEVNVRGILITEQRRHLENIYFVSPERMQEKLTILARIKLLICAAMFAVSLYELALQVEAQFNMSAINIMDIFALIIGLAGTLFLGHCVQKCLALYSACRHKNYLVQFHHQPDAQLYTAAIANKAENLQVNHTRMFDAILAWR